MGRHYSGRDGPRESSDSIRLATEQTQEIVIGRRRTRGLGGALLITLATALLPGTGHLLLRRRTGFAILGGLVLLIGAAIGFTLRMPRADLLEYLLSTQLLGFVIVGCGLAGLLWLVAVVRTYQLAKPPALGFGKRLAGGFVVLVLCVAVAAPFGFAAYLANGQRNLLNTLFPTTGEDSHLTPPGDVNAINKPRINILLLGSDAAPDRVGTRTDTMVVASIDTKTGRTILFGLPRNIANAQFPPGSPMAQRFPSGFNDPHDPASGLLNGVYAYGNEHKEVAPAGPSRDPGLNLLGSSIAHMLGLSLDYYIQVNMQGFAAIIDSLGGLDVNVGPTPVPVGGIGPRGESVRPFGYIPPGQQHLNGEQALWFARSRTNSSDYVRMGRQRCLIQYLVEQKSPLDVLQNFQSVAAATTNSVSTNIPQEILPALVSLADKAKARPLESISFDPNLPDPSERDGRFNTGDPNFQYIRQVVQDAISPAPAVASTTAGAAPPPTSSTRPAAPSTKPGSASRRSSQPTTSAPAAAPTSLDQACSGEAEAK